MSRRNPIAIALAAAVLAVPLIATTATAQPAETRAPAITADGDAPLVIGHRGASGYRPEHTLAGYELAVAMGADYIEPDLVPTKDGKLVARHENEIGGTTDVARHSEFADRRTTKVIDGVSITGWFTEDFTLAELKTLRAVERIPDIRPRNTLYDGLFEIPTLDEVIQLAKTLSQRLGRTVGIYPETKHPTYFRSIGLPLEGPLVASLQRAGLNRPNAEVFVQSFETSNLRELDRALRVPLVQLIAGTGRPFDFVVAGDPRTYADLLTPQGLAEIASYADGIGPDKNRIIPRDGTGRLLQPTNLVADAHAAGLLVHPYTFRNENQFLPLDYRIGTDPAAYGDAGAEYAQFFAQGVDGLFSDNPDTAVAARAKLD